MESVKRVSAEEETKLIEFIRSELLRSVDPKSICQKLVQARTTAVGLLALV